MLEAATLLFFPALMVFALSDLLTMTISNRVSLAIVFLFVVMAFACGLAAMEILWHLACGAMTLALTFAMFARGWIGGGDAKLAAATAIWLAPELLGHHNQARAFLLCFMISGIATIVMALLSSLRNDAGRNDQHLLIERPQKSR